MIPQTQATPIVACFSGQDPTGGAGLQADIEALASMGAHAVCLPTCLTVQDTARVSRVEPVDTGLLTEQAASLLSDLPIAAFKIGLLGNADVASCVAEIISAHPGIPLVLDPVLASGGGKRLADDALIEVLHQSLLPRTTVLTPNTLEAERLTGEADLDKAVDTLLRFGCDYVLLTGTHANSGDTVSNTLFGHNDLREDFHWPRLPGSYHGSGCTLAASLAGLLALDRDLYAAVFEAQQYTWESLEHGWQTAHGQAMPDRFFWAKSES
jgi:hydroxymethylpyrimidine/phosphomethylpyrimidine kinase